MARRPAKPVAKAKAKSKPAQARSAAKAGKARPTAKAKAGTPALPGYQAVIPYLVVRDAPAAIDFYTRAFGAVETRRLLMPDGKMVMHAELRIGDCALMLSEENPAWRSRSPASLGGTPLSLHLYVADVDAAYAHAVACGATGTMPPQDMFWGDRMSCLNDPFGHQWSLATHQEDVSNEEMQRRANESMCAQTGDAPKA